MINIQMEGKGAPCIKLTIKGSQKFFLFKLGKTYADSKTGEAKKRSKIQKWVNAFSLAI